MKSQPQISTMSIDYDVTKDLRFIQGEELGKTEGKTEGKIEIILEGYKNGIAISMLCNISGFTEAQIVLILKNNNLT